MIVIKRSRPGQEVRTQNFDRAKIVNAINGANRDVAEQFRLSDSVVNCIAAIVTEQCEALNRDVHVEEIQDMVERALFQFGNFELAQAYTKYRYNHELRRQQNTTDESILELIHGQNKEMAEENSNKNTTVASTQRDYIAGIVSRDVTMRLLLPKTVKEAHNKGILHFHDADYFIEPISNCCLINIGDMLDNGTMMNGKLIESPKSFQVACTVTTQIIACVASNQYGGQSVDVSHLGKYLRRSRDKFRKKILDAAGGEMDEKLLNRLVDERVHTELSNGVQTIQYQINTLMTTNGQSPFVTLFLYLRDDDPYIEENALIIEEILKQRLLGIKNESGVYVTPAFPKLVYVLDENNNLTGGKYDYLTELAIRCSAKRMYPDYISAKKMRENYEGNVFSPMGCVDGTEQVLVKYPARETPQLETIEDVWQHSSVSLDIKVQPDGKNHYMDTPGLLIYDQKNGFVPCYRIIENYSNNWVQVRAENDFSLLCTADHPLETANRGVVPAGELEVGDKLFVTANNMESTADVLAVSHVEREAYSYDVTTETEHFTVSGIWSHNCRSFLIPWKDDNGEYKFEGRFNQGVVSINLPQIGLAVHGDMDKFWPEFDRRLDLCKEALMCRHKALLGVKSDVSPIHWQYGAIARLKKGETIDKLLYGSYSTLSLGYIGIYELTYLMTGKSHTSPEGKEFALQVMNHLKDTTAKWREETNIGFSLYGTPAESLCYRFARIDKEKYGDIPNVTDKGYYTNSYHVDVREEIDAFSKLSFEAEFQPLSTGGCISYAEIPNMGTNLTALRDLVKFIYDNIQYAEFNTKSDYCQVCGYDGEITIVDGPDGNPVWECPCCGNRDHSKMNVVRRTCGYLGENFWNVGKTKEIKSRVLHLS